MNNNAATMTAIKSLKKGQIVQVRGLANNETFKKDVAYDLKFLGFFGPQPLFTRVSDEKTIPFIAFQLGHVALV